MTLPIIDTKKYSGIGYNSNELKIRNIKNVISNNTTYEISVFLLATDEITMYGGKSVAKKIHTIFPPLNIF